MITIFEKKGALAILLYLNKNPDATILAINQDLIPFKGSKLTTSTIYSRIKELKQLGLISHLPTDKSRLIVTKKANEILKKKGLMKSYYNSNTEKKMRKMTIQTIINNLGSYYNFGNAKSHKMFTIFPVLDSEAEISVLGLIEAEEKELAWIQELEGAESVSQLEAINRSTFPVLIPYLHQVEGGKQDRTIFEPILIPVGYDEKNPLKIPARCIEQSRWIYSSSRGVATSSKFKSAKTRMAPQMANISSKAGDQSTVWATVGAVASMMSFGADEAPTSSYREIQEKVYEKDDSFIELFNELKAALNVENQVGIICAYGDRLLGIEIFGSTKLWDQFREVVLKGFLADKTFVQELETKKTIQKNVGDILRSEFANSEIKEEKSTGVGKLYRFSKKKWEGICLQYEGVPVHIYASKEQVNILRGQRSLTMAQLAVQRLEEFQNIKQETMNVTAPDLISEESDEK